MPDNEISNYGFGDNNDYSQRGLTIPPNAQWEPDVDTNGVSDSSVTDSSED